MKVVRAAQAKEFLLGKTAKAIEYPMGDKDINGAVGIIRGRYPEKGRVVNKKCKEMAYILDGKGKIVVEGEEVDFEKGDLLLIKPGERYFWEGNFKMFMPCTPAWYAKQHKEVK